MKTQLFPLLLTLSLLSGIPLPAAAVEHNDRQTERRYERQPDRTVDRRSNNRVERQNERQDISRQQAADIAQQEHPGRVLGVKRKEKTYRVKTLNRRGELRETRVNARDGKVLRRR